MMVEIERHISNKMASKPADTMAPVHVYPKSCMAGTLKNDMIVSSDVPTDHCLYSKCTHTIISWYISTSGIGVVGGGGAAATV